MPLQLGSETGVFGWVDNISSRGLLIATELPDVRVNEVLEDLAVLWLGERVALPPARVLRTNRHADSPGQLKLTYVACRFESSPEPALDALADGLELAPYVTQELQLTLDPLAHGSEPPPQRDLREFADGTTSSLFDKCAEFDRYMGSFKETGLYQSLYRVTLTTPLDHRVSIYNPARQQEEDFVCFDSNSYLGLHVHPRVVEVTVQAVKEFGYGTPSAQLLSGTNRHLRELEDVISAFHRRDDTIVFSSGYATNVGTITALVGRHDVAIADQYSHTSIHDACAWASSRRLRTYPHRDADALDDVLGRVSRAHPDVGKLVISDGVFSMHGSVADLPSLREVASRHKAALMIDEAHSTGVLGDTGRGMEEHFNCPGAIDVLMGTFSKAPGTSGGYVSGSGELINYLRFFANSAIFSASLPAALCAGIKEAFQIMAEDPEPREQLWANIRWLAPALEAIGFHIGDAQSPILTVFIGDTALLWQVSSELYARGVKCGSVCYPAVPPGEGILRISLNARHTRSDLQRCVSALQDIGQKYDLLNRTKEEIMEIGRTYSRNRRLPGAAE